MNRLRDVVLSIPFAIVVGFALVLVGVALAVDGSWAGRAALGVAIFVTTAWNGAAIRRYQRRPPTDSS